MTSQRGTAECAETSELPPRAPLITLGLLVLLCWRIPKHFFWADEWGFLVAFSDFGSVSWNAPHSGHVFPLFKALYACILSLWGAEAYAFHAASLLVWWGIGVASFRIARKVLNQDRLALLLAAVVVTHPVNSTAILWSFELCISVQLLLQLLALESVLRGPQNPNLLALGSLLLCQNFFFANGAFFPLVCLAVPGAWRRDRAILCGALSALFVSLQLAVSGGRISSSVPELAVNWLAYTVTTIGRLSFMYERIFGSWVVVPALVVFGVVLLAARNTRGWRTLLFLVVWFIAASAAVVAGRGADAASGSRLYYTTLTFLPVMLTMVWAFSNVASVSAIRSITRPAVLLVIVGLFMTISQRAVSVFSSRSVMNATAMQSAIAAGVRWVPFDDPVIDSRAGMHVDADDAKRALMYWTEHGLLARFRPSPSR